MHCLIYHHITLNSLKIARFCDESKRHAFIEALSSPYSVTGDHRLRVGAILYFSDIVTSTSPMKGADDGVEGGSLGAYISTIS